MLLSVFIPRLVNRTPFLIYIETNLSVRRRAWFNTLSLIEKKTTIPCNL